MFNIKLFVVINSVLNLSYFIQAHLTGAYNHDDTIVTGHPDWMFSIPDSTELKQISIPGTHDTMAFYGGDSVQCQALSLMNQLISGIRYLDIRCRHFRNELPIHHSLVYQNAHFDDVLNISIKFLSNNPSECILMRVKEECNPPSIICSPAENTRSFEETFKVYRNQFFTWFWTVQTDTTLKTCRGKIVVLQDFGSVTKRFGLDYGSFNIQDDYNVDTNWGLYGKWEKVKTQLNNANNNRNQDYFLNHLSASGGSFPYFIASGHTSNGNGAARLSTGLTTPGFASSYPDFPRVNCFIGICTIAFEGTNILTNDYIRNNGLKFVGIVISDFPGPDLITAIINCNSNAFQRNKIDINSPGIGSSVQSKGKSHPLKDILHRTLNLRFF